MPEKLLVTVLNAATTPVVMVMATMTVKSALSSVTLVLSASDGTITSLLQSKMLATPAVVPSMLSQVLVFLKVLTLLPELKEFKLSLNNKSSIAVTPTL